MHGGCEIRGGGPFGRASDFVCLAARADSWSQWSDPLLCGSDRILPRGAAENQTGSCAADTGREITPG